MERDDEVIATTARPHFTGKERDAETGLDYFWARYMSGAMGRFTSPDPYIFQNATGQHASDAAEQDQLRDRYISNPQVWNKYAYGLNNPLKFIDPDGKCSQPTNQKEGETGICVEAVIAQNWFKVVGRGDNRGFSGTNKDLTARSRVKLTVGKDGKVTSEEVESARSGVVVKGMGLRGDTVAKTEAKANEDGSVSVQLHAGRDDDDAVDEYLRCLFRRVCSCGGVSVDAAAARYLRGVCGKDETSNRKEHYVEDREVTLSYVQDRRCDWKITWSGERRGWAAEFGEVSEVKRRHDGCSVIVLVRCKVGLGGRS